MKKTSQHAVQPAAVFSFLEVGQRLLELRPFLVLALVIPSLLSMHWLMRGAAAGRIGAFPRITMSVQSIKNDCENAASYGRTRSLYGPVSRAADLEEGRRRYETLRADMTAFVDKLKSAAPRGLTSEDVDEIDRRHRRVNQSFVHLQTWSHGPQQPGQPVLRTWSLPSLTSELQYAHRHFNQPPAEMQQELEACKLKPWQLFQ